MSPRHVKKENKNIRRREILEASHPPHNERLWLAGNLLWYNQNNIKLVCSIIRRANHWDDYDPKVTEAQVKSIAKTKHSSSKDDRLISSSCVEGKDLTSQEVDKLAKEFDWDKAQQEAFAETERMRRCLEHDCYLELECSMRPCWRKGG